MIAEQNVIGHLLMDAKRINDIYAVISPEMFTDAVLGRIYVEFQRGFDNGYEVNASVIVQKLKNEYSEMEVVSAIKECTDNVIIGTTIKSHASVMVNDYKAKQLDRLLTDFRTEPGKIQQQVGRLITELEALQENKKTNTKSLSEIAKENKGLYFTDNGIDKIYFGLSKIDNIIGGLEGGDVIVIGARPAVGKSAFVTQIASNLAKVGKRVGFYNLEMQEKQMYERFVVAQSGIPLLRLRMGKSFLGNEKEKFENANKALSQRDNIIISTGSKSVAEIRQESKHMNYDAIIIDYLQLLQTDKRYQGNRVAEVGAISKAIKSLAMELNIPIIVLSQLNRASEIRDAKEPSMSDLRECGDIEQDASVVMLMWNLSQEDRSKKGFKIDKNRQGNTGRIALNFDGEFMRFVEGKETVEQVNEWVKTNEREKTPFD